MKKLIYTFISFLIVQCIILIDNCDAQYQYQRAIGGTDGDFAHSIARTADSGYVLAGDTEGFGVVNIDMYIVKLNSSGVLQWTRTIGGTGDDYTMSIIQTTDGSYVIAGFTTSFGAGSQDMFIVKLNSSGTLQWTRTIGGTNNDYAYSIIQTADGGYAVAGYTVSYGTGGGDFYIVKLNSSGTLQWSITHGGTSVDIANSIMQDKDGGYTVAGQTGSFGAGNYDMYIMHLNSAGGIQWKRTIGGTGEDYAISVIQTADSSYVLAGLTNSFGAGNYDVYLVKLDKNGSLQWTRTVGGTGFDYAYSITPSIASGTTSYTVAGKTNSFGVLGEDMYIVNVSDIGWVNWSRTAGSTGQDNAYSIIQGADGCLVTAGGTNSFGAGSYDIYLVKISFPNISLCNSSLRSSTSGTGGTLGNPTQTVTSPVPTVTSPTPSVNTGGLLTYICPTVGIEPGANEMPASYELKQNYPNPFNPQTKIKFDIPVQSDVKVIVYDIIGHEVATLVNEQLKPGSYEVQWDGSNFSSGVYYYKLIAGDYTAVKKMILIK